MPEPRPRLRRSLVKALSFLGPGLLAMAGDNDAGGLLSYLTTGATHGAGFFLPLLLPLVAVTFLVQEMALRLGLAGQRSFISQIRSEFGRFWTYFALADLWLFNIITLVTEFAGMGEGLRSIGLSLPAGVILGYLLLAVLTLTGRYRLAEKASILLALLNLAFIPLALFHHPALKDMGLRPVRTGPSFTFFVVATIGNALAPWMIFFQTEAVLEKEMTVRELALGRWDLFTGSLVQTLVAGALLVLGAAFPAHGGFSFTGLLASLSRALGPWTARLLAFGLFDAGFVAAITVSFASAWTVTLGLGWTEKTKPSPSFYGVYLGSALVAAAVVLIPDAPLPYLAVGAQVLSALLLPPLLLFLLLLTADRRLLGPWRNRPLTNVLGALALALFLGSALALII